MNNLKTKLIIAFIASAVIVSVANAREGNRSMYVGEGRYIGEPNTVGDAILRQRNNEWTQRQQDRYEYRQQQEREERLDRQFERDYDYNSDGYD
jgi:hypothetical protein